jgi:FtsP/CotA-like multicopper oxidase with cupredoxin domain
MTQDNRQNSSTRRDFLKTGFAAAAGTSVFSIGNSSRADVPLPIPSTIFNGAIENTLVPRWTDELPRHQWVPPLSTGTEPTEYNGLGVGKVFHGVAPEWDPAVRGKDIPQIPEAEWSKYPVQYYSMHADPETLQVLPTKMGLKTPLWRWCGRAPGAVAPDITLPEFRFRVGQPALVRINNNLPEETGVHMHGGHWPSHSDGHASFFILPGEARDYYYPNVLPRKPGTSIADVSESPSSMWFHDHAQDMTAVHVARGMVGVCKGFDDLELALIARGVLPGIIGKSNVGPQYYNPYDEYLSFTDRVFTQTGEAWYDSNSHNGYIGNVETVNNRAYPKMTVEARKYRFRLHGASTARWRRIRVADAAGVTISFLHIGHDAWLFDRAQTSQSVLLSPGARADIIIDFSKFKPGTQLFIENILEQDAGVGPRGTLESENGNVVVGKPAFSHQLIRFDVVARNIAYPNATIIANTALRPNVKILDTEIAARRTFQFERKNGAWAMNGGFYDKNVANACPTLGSAEEWTLTNSAGGWWHPIHIHLESHQQVMNLTTKKAPPYWDQQKQDVTKLGPNSSITIRMRFRTFKGPFVFHCHNNEHEDFEMMNQFDPRAVGSLVPQPPQQFFP